MKATNMGKALLVDDELNMLSVLTTLLKKAGYDVTATNEPEKAVELLKSVPFDLMVSDIRMRPIDGMALLKVARKEQPSMSVLMITGYGSIETAVESLKLGAFDYITKPFKIDELLVAVQRALAYNKAMHENIDLKAHSAGWYQFDSIIAESAAMRNVCEMIRRVAPTETTVLISGERGTGKKLIANAIHEHSNRKNNKFQLLNCSAVSELQLESELFGHVKGAFADASSDKQGLFEVANDATVFVSNIEAIPLSIQPKLLSVLEEKKIRRVGGNENISVNVRVLAATSSRLENLIERKLFRQDLYSRLSVIHIEIPPLRERHEDILPLAYHFLKQNAEHGKALHKIDSEVAYIFKEYSWPGNATELQNTIKHALTFVKDNVITKNCLPPKILQAVPIPAVLIERTGERGKSLKAFLRKEQQEYLLQVLDNASGGKQEAAKKGRRN